MHNCKRKELRSKLLVTMLLCKTLRFTLYTSFLMNVKVSHCVAVGIEAHCDIWDESSKTSREVHCVSIIFGLFIVLTLNAK
jgi:hypothetical protein